MITAKGAIVSVLALTITGVMSSCAGDPSNDNAAPEPMETRAPEEPILGANSSPEGSPPECDESVFTLAPDSPNTEFTIHGQPGDAFSYELTKKDGTKKSDKSGQLAPAQTGVLFNTEIPNAEVDTLTISAEGEVGESGQCVVTTIT